jgi:predicted AAA+ superfamily ATPase
MKRNAISELAAWKSDPRRKPLIIRGARQVGKTWLMKEFGKQYYDHAFYFSFDDNNALKRIFEPDKNPRRIVDGLGVFGGRAILPGAHLIIFDEIQECPQAMGSLKYFCEDANEYHVVAAGSLLGTYLAKPMSWPVGKADLIDLYPMTFDEYLAAADETLYRVYSAMNKDDTAWNGFHRRFLEAYNIYLIVGGMPESVLTWAETKDAAGVGQVQRKIISMYEHDIAKHHGSVNSGRILMAFRSIVAQLSKENEKFIYGCIKQGARAREFEDAVEWLVSSGIIVRTYNVSKPESPLKAFEMFNHFKLFMFDVGLLKYMAEISNKDILLQSDFQFKGPLAENYVLQQIRSIFRGEPRYFARPDLGEIDFLAQDDEAGVIPIEVKAGESAKARSFNKYIDKHSPRVAIRYSKLEYGKNERFVNIPLYLAGKTKDLI